MLEQRPPPIANLIDRYMHPAVRRRILTASPNPAMQLQACWDVAAEQTERLEEVLRAIAANENGDETNIGGTSPSTASQQIALLAAGGLQLARSLMLNRTHEDADTEGLSKTVLRLLSNISILLTALSECSALSEHSSSPTSSVQKNI